MSRPTAAGRALGLAECRWSGCHEDPAPGYSRCPAHVVAHRGYMRAYMRRKGGHKPQRPGHLGRPLKSLETP